MSRRLLALAALSVVLVAPAGPLRAQGEPPHQPDGFGVRARTSTLDLLQAPGVQATLQITAAQNTRFQELRTKLLSDLRMLSSGGDRREALRKIPELRQKADTDALAILTPTQRRQYDAVAAEAQEFQGLGRAAMALPSVTGLSRDQKVELRKLADGAIAKRQELLRGASRNAGAFRRLQLIDQETAASVRKLLTPAQLKQFDDALKGGTGRRAG